MKKALSVYIHIPYCVRKCLYCDFLSYPLSSCQGKQVKEYLSRLKEEIIQEGAVYRDRTVSSVFFGGGTPSSLPEGEIGALMEAVHGVFTMEADAEITIECNPGTVTHGKLAEYQRSGINRLSFGLQSVHNEELHLLGRIHTHKEFEENYKAAREAGFRNINVDLMSGLPGQTTGLWEDTLRRVAKLGPEHISAYSLIVEEGTPFYERYGDGTGLPEEDTEREMVHRTGTVLSEYGYRQYEISNYSKPGYECRHNLVYWRRGDYLGIGLGAASCVDEVRWKNNSKFERYIGKCVDDKKVHFFEKLQEEKEHLEPKEQRFEALMLGLRLNKGVDLKEFEVRYGEKLIEARGDKISKLCSGGLLDITGGRLYLTEYGRDLADYVLRELA